MHIASFLLANRGSVGPDALLNVEGAGWEFYLVPRFPWTVSGVAVGLIEFLPEEEGSHRLIRMELMRPTGEVFNASASMSVHVAGKVAPFAVPFTLSIDAPGEIQVSLHDEGGPLAQMSFVVRQKEDDLPLPPLPPIPDD